MCGIFACFAKNGRAIQLVCGGIKLLNYRGYDSCGISWISAEGKTNTSKSIGDVGGLLTGAYSQLAIGHTRWATHGKVSLENAHPQVCDDVSVVHNGIIDNFQELKDSLKNYKFKSETDTEIIAVLLAKYRFVETVVNKLKGTYSFVSLIGNKLFAYNNGLPLIVGFYKDGFVISSDLTIIQDKINGYAVMEKGQYFDFDLDSYNFNKKPKYSFYDSNHTKVKPQIKSNILRPIKKDDFKYASRMMCEINQQPKIIENTVNFPLTPLQQYDRIVILAQGSSYYAGLVGKEFIENNLEVPVTVEYGCDFRYRKFLFQRNALYIAISQSGETLDTIEAVKYVKENNGEVIALVNNIESTLGRLVPSICLNAGPEYGVAATKTFMSQVCWFLFQSRLGDCVHWGACSGLADKFITNNNVLEIANKYYRNSSNFLFLGRGIGYPLALEGALKLKEVSYIHAEGIEAGEMKHGPIALIDSNMPVVVLALKGRRYSKVLSNIHEIKARNGRVIAITEDTNIELCKLVDDAINIPECRISEFTSLLAILPLHLLAYYIGRLKGFNVDKPRNLAKCVTVE